MSFTATLYNCSDDPRKLNKTLSADSKIVVSSITPTNRELYEMILAFQA